jgi:3-dehydroquinate synthase
MPFNLIENFDTFLPEFFQNRNPTSVFLLTDQKVKRHCLPILKNALPKGTNIITIRTGEEHKTLETCTLVWNELTKKNADRKALLLNLGGGVVGDLGGFAAAVYKRGIPFVQIPTTLLAMVDASLGGKTGVDFEGFKNQIGVFSQPEDVWVFPEFLKTLPETELLSGFAEVLKHALISDAVSWNFLRKRELENQNWKELIPASLSVKEAIVQADPFEKGERKKLNAGHTLGHALETYLLKKGTPKPHGYCVAAGLVMESSIAVERGLLEEKEMFQIEELVYSLFGSIPIQKSEIKNIVKLAAQDKKNEGGKVNLSLVGPIGTCQIDCFVSQQELFNGVSYYL